MPQRIDTEYAVVNLSSRPNESWMEKGCHALSIMGVTQVEDANNKPFICAVVEVSNREGLVVGQDSSRKELLPTSYLRLKCPQLLIKFYEDKITPM